MTDFDEHARRAGAELNRSVVDLTPAAEAPSPSRSRRTGVGIALAFAIAGGLLTVANRGDHRDGRLVAQVSPTATADAPTPHYLPRWLPDGFQRGSGRSVVGFACLTGVSPAATVVSATPAPPEVSIALVVTSASGCPTESWTTIFNSATFGGAPVFMTLTGTTTTTPMQQGETVSVHSRPASLSDQGQLISLAWAEADINLRLTGFGISRADLLRVADSVVRVDDDEWNATRSPTDSGASVAVAPPNFADATELAQLTTTTGQLVRLLRLSDADGLCIDAGTSRGCGSSSQDPASRLPTGTALLVMATTSDSQHFGAILLPSGLPGELALRRSTGETVQSVRSSDNRYLLFADPNPVLEYDVVDTTGQVLARVATSPVPCPTLVTPTAISCIPPSTITR